MAQKFTGRDVQATLGNGIRVLFDTVTLTPDLGFGVAKTQGRPDGWTSGEAGADGEITLSTVELAKVREAAAAAGSWAALEALDLTLFGLQDGVELKVEAFGCKLGPPDFNFDSGNNERLQHKISFMVTGRDFIKLNGVPLLDPIA
jgi:hypothetical protein